MSATTTARPAVVIGTAGHIDHGKTTLLRALTGIDADRLPEERRRGMTIDVGYAHVALPGGALDFVDVPGHERLVGNMLVGAGEIDGALLVVAADDGPNEQTFEHLELLDALGIEHGVVAVTRCDLVDAATVERVTAEATRLLAPTTLAGSEVVPVAAPTGRGLDELQGALERLQARIADRPGFGTGPTRLAIDRVFAVRGRGTVVTGSLRGGPVAAGDVLRLVPDGGEARVREVQVHNRAVDSVGGGGRVALLLGGIEGDALSRGSVLTADPEVSASSRVLVELRPAIHVRAGATRLPDDRERSRLHLGTSQAGALVLRAARDSVQLEDGATAILRLDRTLAVAPGDRFALRRPSPARTVGGGTVIDARPPRGLSRRRSSRERLVSLVSAATRCPLDRAAVHRARLALHGALREDGRVALAPDVAERLAGRAVELVAAHHAADAGSAGLSASILRGALAVELRRQVTLDRSGADNAVDGILRALAGDGRLARDGDRYREPGRSAGLSPEVRVAMDRLEARLATAMPPPLALAAREVGCPPDGIRALVAERRIVRLEDDLAWSADTYRDLARRALEMAARGPLTPAAYRDATGSSRRFALAILEDLDRRELLRRTPDGHRLGPRARMRLVPARQGGGPPDGEAS